MTVEQEAKGMFASEDSTNVQIPCGLAAITFEIYESFKSILKSKATAQRIKLYAVLAKLVTVKPEFVFAMGRLDDDFLPPVEVLFAPSTDIVSFGALDKKLAISMCKFLQACCSQYGNLEELDQQRFNPNLIKIKGLISSISTQISSIKDPDADQAYLSQI